MEIPAKVNGRDHQTKYQTPQAANQNGEEDVVHVFRCRDMFLQQSVFYPFLVILVLMFLLQFSGQGAITFYTALIFLEAKSAVDPNDCALIIGVTYFASSIFGLILKKHFGRRILLLISEFGMALSQISLGVYFYMLNFNNLILNTDVTLIASKTSAVNSTTNAPTGTGGVQSTPSFSEDFGWLHWLPLPILVIYTLAFNIGMGSLTWVVATEILPVRSRRWSHTVANVTSNFWWFIVTKTFKDVYTDIGPHVPFFLYGLVCLIGFVFIYVFLPETQGLTAEERAEAFTGMQPIINRVAGRCLRRRSHRGSSATRNSNLQCLEQQPLTDNSPSPSATTPLKQQNHVSTEPKSTKPLETTQPLYQMRPLRKPSSSSPNLQQFHQPQEPRVSSLSFRSKLPPISKPIPSDSENKDKRSDSNIPGTKVSKNHENKLNRPNHEENRDSSNSTSHQNSGSATT